MILMGFVVVRVQIDTVFSGVIILVLTVIGFQFATALIGLLFIKVPKRTMYW